ncbi:hypothetical protein D3C87_2046030 [compost metagenome]
MPIPLVLSSVTHDVSFSVVRVQSLSAKTKILDVPAASATRTISLLIAISVLNSTCSFFLQPNKIIIAINNMADNNQPLLLKLTVVVI